MATSKLDRLLNTFKANWFLKTVALLLAVLSFYAIRGATRFEVRYDIPLEIQVGEGIAILDPPKTVKVTFRGSKEDLRRIDQQQIKAVVRPRAVSPSGSENIRIKPGEIQGLSGGVRVVEVEPGRIILNFDREVTKMFPVAEPRVIGTPLIGRAEIEYHPREVEISGPERRLENTTVVETEPVEVSGRASSFTARVPVLSPGDTWVAEIDPPEVTVEVKIVTESVTRVLTNITVNAMIGAGSPEKAVFDPPAVSVSLHGRVEIVNNISRNALRVFVDCVDLETAAEYRMPVKIHLPSTAGVTAHPDPKTVKAVIVRPPAE
ncbi:MAG: CdaR family protein [Kiritimatiellia bacterium]